MSKFFSLCGVTPFTHCAFGLLSHLCLLYVCTILLPVYPVFSWQREKKKTL